jgi:hypothetical protein
VPETFMPATSSLAKETPETSAPAKDMPSLPPAPSAGQPAPAPEPTRPEGANVIALQLAAAVTAATAPPSGSQSLVLHAGRAAIVAGKRPQPSWAESSSLAAARLTWVCCVNTRISGIGRIFPPTPAA